jgi:hypothetical protein
MQVLLIILVQVSLLFAINDVGIINQVQAAKMPVYLFAGQSNMQGNVDKQLFSNIFSIIHSGHGIKTIQPEVEETLNNWYQTYSNGYAKYAYSPEVSQKEAGELVALRKQGYLGASYHRKQRNRQNAFCTSTNDPAKPITSEACGNPFGPEYMFGRVMSLSSPFTVLKVAEGGTSLSTDWISPSAASNGRPGPMFEQLVTRIKSLVNNSTSVHKACANENCYFKAFVWFQGENDCFEEGTATSYASNLKGFISDVRAAIGDPNIPVVIVQLGYWATTLSFGPLVMRAQEEFVQQTQNTILVRTSDLSRYFHFDPAAQIIIGQRIARAVQMLHASLTDNLTQEVGSYEA